MYDCLYWEDFGIIRKYKAFRPGIYCAFADASSLELSGMEILEYIHSNLVYIHSNLVNIALELRCDAANAIPCPVRLPEYLTFGN